MAKKSRAEVSDSKPKGGGMLGGLKGLIYLGIIAYFGVQFFSGKSEDGTILTMDQPEQLTALLDENKDLTLAGFKKLDRVNRDNLVKASMTRFDAPENSLDKFTACIGDFTFSKSADLEWIKVMGWCDNERQNNPERFADHFDELNAKDLTTMAKIICEGDVKQRLRSPASADFPFLDYRHLNKGRQRYLIQSYVDSQNAFGADIRTNWTCDIQYNGSGEDADRRNWTVHTLEMF